MDLLVLGSGTSHGVPMIGCECEVCRSTDPRNRRFRPSVLVRHNGKAILIDTTPELRMQSLAFNLRRVDAVLITHTHADHVMGLDDLRRFNDLSGREMPVYGDDGALDDIRRIYDYIFRETQMGGGKPRLSLHPVQSDFEMFGLRIRSFTVMHGRLPILAYRFDAPATDQEPAKSIAYVTDVSYIPPQAMEQLTGLDVLLLDAVRFLPHPTHFSIWQAVDIARRLGPRRTCFVHLSHHFEHNAVNAMLPNGIELAYDGMVV